MGVYIKGMEVPTDGSMIFAIRPDGMVEDVMGCYVGKAIPVPPHGRCIDADALEADFFQLDWRTGEQDAVGFSEQAIDEAPTIIPAEEDDE